MILKSFEIEQNIEIIKNFKAVLFYGDNKGIMNDIKELIKEDKEAEFIGLFQSEILKNEKGFLNEISQNSLFIRNKKIFIDFCDDKFVKFLEKYLEDINQSTKIILFSDRLDLKSKLRAYFEKNRTLAIIPCYEDTDNTLVYYVKKKLKEFGNFNLEIVRLIIERCNSDRRLIKNEIEKVKILFKGEKLDLSKISILITNTHNEKIDILCESCLNSEKKKLGRLITETKIDSEELIFLIGQLYYKFGRIKKILDNEEKNKMKVIESLQPKVFWKDKDRLFKQSQIWNKNKINQATLEVEKTELQVKSSGETSKNVIAKQLLTNLFRISTST